VARLTKCFNQSASVSPQTLVPIRVRPRGFVWLVSWGAFSGERIAVGLPTAVKRPGVPRGALWHDVSHIPNIWNMPYAPGPSTVDAVSDTRRFAHGLISASKAAKNLVAAWYQVTVPRASSAVDAAT